MVSHGDELTTTRNNMLPALVALAAALVLHAMATATTTGQEWEKMVVCSKNNNV